MVFYCQSLRPLVSVSLHFTPGLHFVPPPSYPFCSLSSTSLDYPRKSDSIHSTPLRPTHRFILLPFAFFTHNPKPKQEAPFCPTPFTPFHSVNTLAFPNPINGMSCEVFTPATKAPPPFNSEGKIKDYLRMAFVLAVGSSQSFSRSIRTSFHYFICSSHQLQHPTCKCFVPQHPHLSPPTATFPLIFTCELFAP
jgi:hypothetical protein